MIKLINVSKKIKSKDILQNISLDLKPNNIYGFTGHNGCGKTMLFRVIAGFVKPTKGKVELVSRDIGILIENPGFVSNITGYENLKLLASIKKVIANEDIKEVMIEVGLDPKDKRKYKEYSLGMRQKLGIAQAIMEKPSILILDEPTRGIDNENVENIRKLIKKHKNSNTVILIASHDDADIIELCTEVYTINNGKIVN